MSVFAGVVSFDSDRSLNADLLSEIDAAVSRHPEDKAHLRRIKDDGVYIASLDLGALNESEHSATEAPFAFVAGDPILQQDSDMAPMPRTESIGKIAANLAKASHAALRSCRGTYCATVYDAKLDAVFLVTDKLGVRPIYCWVGSGLVAFASALRILEAMKSITKSLDLQGLAEMACFGYPLADRTSYREIFALYAGEVVTIDRRGIRRERYWRWDEVAPGRRGGVEPSDLFDVFQDAIRVRLGRDKIANAFLSGGLDSRSIVAVLKGLGTEVRVANFASPDSQDRVLGEMAARALGVAFHALPRVSFIDHDPYSKKSLVEWLDSQARFSSAAERPRVVWSGDGGSVGLGHVYLTEAMVEALRKGDMSNAIRHYVSHNRCRLQGQLLNSKLDREMQSLVEDGLRTELAASRPADAGRGLYSFLMMNDQRRHMFHHFENLDIERVEFELPFFDARFVGLIFASPIDDFLRHKFYMRWLACFGPRVLTTAWQAYPGHVPCHLPRPDGLSYQWDAGPSRLNRNERGAVLRRIMNLLSEREFATQYMRRTRAIALAIATQVLPGDRSYLLRAPETIARYWCRTQGGLGKV